MSSLSKLAGSLGMYTSTFNCHEVAHTWNPDCHDAALDVFRCALPFALKTYLPLYAVSLGLRGNYSSIKWHQFFIDLFRSSLFLATNGGAFVFFICRLRNWLGFWTTPLIGPLPALFASFTAIQFERLSRRPMLALYLTNLSSEIGYRMLNHRGLVPMIPHGQVLIFMTALGTYMSMLKTDSVDASTAKVLRTIFCMRVDDSEDTAEHMPVIDVSRLPSSVRAVIETLRETTKENKHAACQHRHSCVATVVESFTRNYTIGMGITSALHVAKNVKSLTTSPLHVIRGLLSKKQLFGLPFMLAALPSIYHSFVCLSHHHTGNDSTVVHGMGGALAGSAMLAFENTSVAMYTLWKAIELLVAHGQRRGIIPNIPYASTLLYSISTAYVLTTAVVEPHAMRPSYYRFLHELTGGHLDNINRPLIDTYGWQGKVLNPYFQPKLDPMHSTWNPHFGPNGYDKSKFG